jgi:hypothetical protein
VLHLVFSCLLPFWILWLSGAYSMRHNVELTGARNAAKRHVGRPG